MASHVATTALLLAQNGLRSNIRASNFKKFPGGACPKTPLVLHTCLFIHAYIHISWTLHVTSLIVMPTAKGEDCHVQYSVVQKLQQLIVYCHV